jgi:hypothetical protein
MTMTNPIVSCRVRQSPADDRVPNTDNAKAYALPPCRANTLC